MNAEKLKGYMKQNGISPEELAPAANMDISTWYRKLQKHGDSFTVKEMNEIILFSKMKLSDAAEIFFDEDGGIRDEFFYYADEEDKMFLWEQWSSREAQKKHCQQPHFLELSKIKEKYGVETDIQIEDQESK